jgi:hypothetical protein
MEEISVIYAAPIPVGHRVEIRWYSRSKAGLFGASKTQSREFEPVIKDLNSGIEYLSDFVVERGSAKYPKVPLKVASELLEDLEVSRTLVGKVTACRVVTIRGFSEYDVQTHLSIEPER